MSDAGILHSTAAVCARWTAWLRVRGPQSRASGLGPARVRDDFFYAADAATHRSSDFDDPTRLQARASAHVPHTYAPFFKAAFLDRVARDERDAVQFQFRPLGLAARVRIRAARVEGAA